MDIKKLSSDDGWTVVIRACSNCGKTAEEKYNSKTGEETFNIVASGIQ